MNKQELKSCPLCGGEAEFRNFVADRFINPISACFVQCKECEARTNVFHDTKGNFEYRQQAIEAWNRRVDNE